MSRLLTADPDLGEEMSEEDLLKHFGEKPKKKKKEKVTENGVYQVSARVKNLARGAAGANLTNAGDVLCNSYTHVLLSLYEFAETLRSKKTKAKLIELIRKNEKMAADVIAALAAGVNIKK